MMQKVSSTLYFPVFTMYFILGLFGTLAIITEESVPKLLQTALLVSLVDVAVSVP